MARPTGNFLIGVPVPPSPITSTVRLVQIPFIIVMHLFKHNKKRVAFIQVTAIKNGIHECGKARIQQRRSE